MLWKTGEPSALIWIDWTVRENVRAQLCVFVKRIQRKHGYPPDKQEKAAQTVLEQAEVLSQEWARWRDTKSVDHKFLTAKNAKNWPGPSARLVAANCGGWRWITT